MSGPEVVTPKQITAYMKALNETPGALAQMGQLTYHLYWDPFNVIQRNEIRNWSNRLGITTAQTEWLEGKGLNVAEVIYLDLTEADASSWEQYGLCYTANRYNKGGGGDYFVITQDYANYYMNTNAWYLHQFMKYVRPGDVRIAISSSNPKIKPVAFLKPDGRQTVVVINAHKWPKNIEIKNLASGSYDVIFTDSNNKGQVLPQQVVAGSKTLIFQIPAKSVVTLHGKS
jgi:glucosylceramidase